MFNTYAPPSYPDFAYLVIPSPESFGGEGPHNRRDDHARKEEELQYSARSGIHGSKGIQREGARSLAVCAARDDSACRRSNGDASYNFVGSLSSSAMRLSNLPAPPPSRLR